MWGRRKIGMLTPSSNSTLEPVTCAMLAGVPELTVHFARFPVTRISLEGEALRQFDLAPMLAAARLLADAHMDVIAWNGTSGAWLGVGQDRALAERMERELGVRSTTSTLALLEACRELGVRRIGLAVPYLPEVAERIARTYEGEGLKVVAQANLGISTNWEFAEVPAARIRDLVRRVAVPEVQAVAVVCTNLPAAWLVEELEAETGKPVLDSVAVVVWHALRLMGWDRPVYGWGRLLREAQGAVRGTAGR